jgi:GAF domain-containing protein
MQSLMELSEVLLRERTLGVNLALIAQAATETVTGCDGASIALSVQGRPATAAITTRVALEVDMVQYDTGEGPCLTALGSPRSVRIDAIETSEDFPHFAVGARKLGVQSVLSVPAMRGEDIVGTLNLYSRTPGAFDETSETIARVLAAQIAIAISRSPEYSAARNVTEQAQRDTDDNADISVATGILIATEDCTAEQAAGLLRHAANQDAQTVLQIAQRIIRQAKHSR